MQPAKTRGGESREEAESEGGEWSGEEGVIRAQDLLAQDYEELDGEGEAEESRKGRGGKGPLVVWYADAETQVDEKGDHNANLVVLQRPKGEGAYEEKVYKGEDAMRQFTADCMSKKSPFKGATVCWHNASKFDAHLWYKELVLAGSPPTVIFRGQAILSMTLRQNKIRCRDSLQFIPNTRLAQFPGMFGLESGPKGDFPHSINTSKWVQWGKGVVYQERDEEGETHFFPPLHYFHPENRRGEELESLKEWHEKQVEEHRGGRKKYIPEQHLLTYCQQDVRILREGFEKYRQTWKAQFPDMEPLDYLTFPSFNNAVYRTKYMQQESICLLPPKGYSLKNRQYSVISLAWISWLEKELGLKNVRTARKGFEVRMAGHYCDGVGEDEQGVIHVMEYHGCYFHNCPLCFPKQQKDWQLRRFANTKAVGDRFRELERQGETPYGRIRYHEVWACQLKQQQKQNPALKAYLDDYIKKFSHTHLQPRASLRGGRTNSIHHRVRVDVKAGERCVYWDYCSLYPRHYVLSE